MGRIDNIYRCLSVPAILIAAVMSAQDVKVDSLVALGDSLHREYCFERASQAYYLALEEIPDTSAAASDSLKRIEIGDRLLLSGNARNMSAFVDSPKVVARHRFSLQDFFLYYPLADGAWRPVPNVLDSLSGPLARAMYVPEGSDVIYYSAPDKEGIRNIYRTEREDTVWTVPSLVNEHLTSASDEVYPVISADGRQMYFSSRGLQGMGGYDLFVSRWDEDARDWSEPVNLGFPYSSPADDFIFVNSEDGRYSVFASNRGCPSDSVWVYVLEFNDMPVRRAENDPAQMKKLAELEPVGYGSGMAAEPKEKNPQEENPQVRRYMAKMEEVRSLRDTIAFYEESLQDERSRYALSTDDDERMALTDEILKREAVIPVFQDSLGRATRQLQKIEMDFLMKGIILDWDDFMAEADKEVVVEPSTYAFTRSHLGDSLDIRVAEPEVEFDYSFMVLEQGRLAEDQTIPEGIVYQIQIFSTASQAPVKSFKGLSPVYEQRTSSGRYVYRVGVFGSYKGVLENLNTVKKVGFRSAIIVAYIDGKEVSVAKARAAEAAGIRQE